MKDIENKFGKTVLHDKVFTGGGSEKFLRVLEGKVRNNVEIRLWWGQRGCTLTLRFPITRWLIWVKREEDKKSGSVTSISGTALSVIRPKLMYGNQCADVVHSLLHLLNSLVAFLKILIE